MMEMLVICASSLVATSHWSCLVLVVLTGGQVGLKKTKVMLTFRVGNTCLAE